MAINLVKKFNDRKTLEQLKSRDKDAFARVYDENVEDIHRFIFFKVGNKEEANDLTSMVFLKTWNYIQNSELEKSKTLRALLYKIARNLIIDHYRQSSGKKPISLDNEDNYIEIVDEEQDPHEETAEKADLELIKSKLPLLKDEYRAIIVLRFINDLTLEEIAEITHKTKGNIRVLLHRSLNALKKLVEEEGR